jgi:hypothetical protein
MGKTGFKEDLSVQDVAKANEELSEIVIELIKKQTELEIEMIRLRRRISDLEKIKQ